MREQEREGKGCAIPRGLTVGLERHLLAKKVSKMVLPHVDSSEHGHCEEKGGERRERPDGCYERGRNPDEEGEKKRD